MYGRGWSAGVIVIRSLWRRSHARRRPRSRHFNSMFERRRSLEKIRSSETGCPHARDKECGVYARLSCGFARGDSAVPREHGMERRWRGKRKGEKRKLNTERAIPDRHTIYIYIRQKCAHGSDEHGMLQWNRNRGSVIYVKCDDAFPRYIFINRTPDEPI